MKKPIINPQLINDIIQAVRSSETNEQARVGVIKACLEIREEEQKRIVANIHEHYVDCFTYQDPEYIEEIIKGETT